MDFAPPRGTSDLFPPESDAVLSLQEEAHRLARLYGYRYVDTPAFEHTELFARTSGASSEIVTKEMYTFEDKGGRSLTLRPEGTAPVVRAYLERRQDLPTPFKAYYVLQTWRRGRPQAGRLREFRQFGIEVIGTASPAADVEVMSLADTYARDRGLNRFTLYVNSIGDEACRPAYRELLVAFLNEHGEELCKDSRERIDSNPLRIFDCKEEECRAVMRDAPVISDHLCDACREHFAGVQSGLDEEGIAYEHEPRLVRGLDYYTRTAFEFVSGILGTREGTFCGGGRYDRLAEMLGGPPTPGIGFGLGLERTLLAMQGEGVTPAGERAPAVFVVTIGDRNVWKAGDELVRALRLEGIGAVAAYEERPLKAQLRMADHSGAVYAAIIGEREFEAGTVTVRRLADGEQESVAVSEVRAWISERV